MEHYVEIDFPENTARKALAIRKNDALNRHLVDIMIGMMILSNHLLVLMTLYQRSRGNGTPLSAI